MMGISYLGESQMREHRRRRVVFLARLITQFFLLDKDVLPTEYGPFCLDPYYRSVPSLNSYALFVFRQAGFQTFWFVRLALVPDGFIPDDQK